MVDIDNVTAYNVKLKKTDNMEVTNVIRTPIMKEGSATGNYRYRLAGVGSDGTGMSKFIKASDAQDYADQLGKNIVDAEPKSSGARKKKKTCKQVGEDAESLCIEKKENAKIMREMKKPAAKKPAAKKPAAKKSAAKKPAAKKK